jgi:hypothetical protein
MTTVHSLFASSISGPAWLSGGTAGPEGSIAALAALLLASLYVWFRVPRRAAAALGPPLSNAVS